MLNLKTDNRRSLLYSYAQNHLFARVILFTENRRCLLDSKAQNHLLAMHKNCVIMQLIRKVLNTGGNLRMSLQVEKLEKNMVKLTIEATAEEFEAAIQKAYLKNRGKMTIQGFRKGKAPRAIIEKMYGVGVFYEDAANAIIPSAYEKAAAESGLDIVSQPDIDVVQIEKGKSFIFTAEVAVKPEVTLGEYKGVAVEKASTEVTLSLIHI